MFLWPDFNKEELKKAIVKYNERDRRFGGVKNRRIKYIIVGEKQNGFK